MLSAARALGIWVVDNDETHVWLRHEASRMRSPEDRFTRLDATTRSSCRLHWWPLARPADATSHAVGVVDALAQVIRCQPSGYALAALDSALWQRQITHGELASVFDAVPEKYRSLRPLVDGRSMSGLETLIRLLARGANLRCEVQARISGVGKVDLLVEGCVVIETDGDKWHSGEELQKRDYYRDVKLIIRGYSVLRLDYWQVILRPEEALAAIVAAVHSHARWSGNGGNGS